MQNNKYAAIAALVISLLAFVVAVSCAIAVPGKALYFENGEVIIDQDANLEYITQKIKP